MKVPPFYEINSDVFVIGSVISTKKEELNHILDQFNIQVIKFVSLSGHTCNVLFINVEFKNSLIIHKDKTKEIHV